MKCPNCGKKIANDSQFCEFCGAKINLVLSEEGKDASVSSLKWINFAFFVIFISIVIWAICEHTMRSKTIDSLNTAQENIDKSNRLVDSLQNVIAQTDDKILMISDGNFDDFVALSYQHLVIIDYYGKWCEPCRKLDPSLYEVVKEYHGRVSVGRYIVDDFKEKYVKRFDVTGIPTLIFLVNGREKKRIIGLCEKADIVEVIERFIRKDSSFSYCNGNFINLGLPSGTLWKDENEDGLYTQAKAIEKFGSNMPTKQEFKELYSKCKWEALDGRYKVIGPNGKYIFLPASGNGESHYAYREGNFGAYWSSSLSIKNEGSERATDNGLGFYIEDKYVFLWDFDPLETLSVRLVQR